MNILKSKTNRAFLRVSAICLFFLILIWGSYWRQRSFDKKDSIRYAVGRNSNLAVALEQYAIKTVHSANAVLQVVKMEYADQGPMLDLKKLLANISFNQEITANVSIIGADGRLKKSNLPFSPDAVPYYSASPFFIFHQRNKIDTLFISKPMASKNKEKATIVISRRLYDDKGGFAGVVALEVLPSAFTSFYAQAQLLPNDIISLIALDGITYARRTGNRESSGENISKSPLFEHLTKNADSFYFAPDAIHNVPSWFSYRKLKDYPIIATVGSSEADILADFRTRQLRFIIPRIIISILVVLFSVFITFFLQHRRKLSDRLLREEENYKRQLTEQMIAVQEREREWIGRELHDNVNQVLTTVKLYLETAARESGNPIIPRSMQLINSSICEIRNLSHQLSAPTLGTRSLVDSINALVETISFSKQIKFEFDHARYSEQADMSQKLALYRILQEQLNNIIKHAHATEVSISLFQKDGNTVLTVMDNGKGFDPAVKTNGMGINNIISRARVLNGTAHVEAAPGKGCFLTVAMPAIVLGEKPCYN